MAVDINLMFLNLSYFTHVKTYFRLLQDPISLGIAFLPPQKSERYHAREYQGEYHAREYQGANRQITNLQELFNYRHSSLRMVIE